MTPSVRSSPLPSTRAGFQVAVTSRSSTGSVAARRAGGEIRRNLQGIGGETAVDDDRSELLVVQEDVDAGLRGCGRPSAVSENECQLAARGEDRGD